MILPNSKIIFAGDSITEAGRSPQGELTPWQPMAGLGFGYVNQINAFLTSSRPQDRIRVINRGAGGRTVFDLKAAWADEVMALNPDWISIMIGTNDVWRRYDSSLQEELHVSIEDYQKALEELLLLSIPFVKSIVLVTPYVLEKNPDDPFRQDIIRYGQVMRMLATKYDATLVDTQAAFDEVLKFRHPTELSWDRIHPDTVGHMVISRAWLRAIGFKD